MLMSDVTGGAWDGRERRRDVAGTAGAHETHAWRCVGSGRRCGSAMGPWAVCSRGGERKADAGARSRRPRTDQRDYVKRGVPGCGSDAGSCAREGGRSAMRTWRARRDPPRRARASELAARTHLGSHDAL